jgi:hypothetical protein
LPASRRAPGLMIAIPSYGLANRLRTMGSAKVMADALGKDFRLIWERRGDIPDARWLDLFEPSPDIVEFDASGLRGRLLMLAWTSPLAGARRLHALGGQPYARKAAHELLHTFTTHENTPYACAHRFQTKPCSIHAELSVVLDPRWRHISLRGQFNYKLVAMNDEEYVRRMRDFYVGLRPVPEVLRLADDLTREFSPRVALHNPSHAEITASSAQPITIGVHCRQTDNSMSFYEGLIPPGSYHAHIDRAIERFPNARLFVAADTAAARDRIRERYGARLLHHASETSPALAERYTLLGQRAALADMIALSRTSLLIGTRFSSFTYVSAFLGETPFIETGLDMTPNPLT